MIDRRRLDRYVNDAGGPCAAIFDIGTRAARLLVGPREVPATEWGRYTFFNDADLSELGADVGKYHRNLPIGGSQALERVVRFLKGYRGPLRDAGIADEDVLAIGTAVFRWLGEEGGNQAEVLRYLRERTGVAIKVISDKDEAMYSLAGISLAYRTRPGGPKIQKDDVIVLLDQGGGSMEVSYISALRDRFGVHSFDELGTTALRHRFLTTGASGRVEPEDNASGIGAQTRRISEWIDAQIAAWPGYPELQGRPLHAYAMGSAITNCYRNASSFEVHNKVCTVERMTAIVDETCAGFEKSRQQVRTIHRALQGELAENTRAWQDVENQLLTLYGLPVYMRILQRFGLSELRVCGYGLRYGYYVWRYFYKIKDD